MRKITFVCPVCQKEFSRKPSSVKVETPCCSHSCSTKITSRGERVPLETRFWGNVKIGTPEECWEWQGIKDRHGYGYLKINGKKVKAHRFAFMYKNGPISSKVLVCHKCDNRLCCNYNHHFSGTPTTNMVDRDNKSRQAKGERISLAKVTADQVTIIRELYKTGNYTQKVLAASFNLTQGTIGRIVNGKTWKHI